MGTLPGKIDAEAILQTLAEIRRSIPYELRPLPPEETASPITTARDAESVDDFELATVEEGLTQLIAELRDALDRARANALQEALRIYYAAEELARDPAHADLIPLVEAMRQAYQADYGMPIPPKRDLAAESQAPAGSRRVGTTS